MSDDHVSAILKTEDVPGTIAWYTRVGFVLREADPGTEEADPGENPR
ncbi:MAG TPA: hypothetical protein VNP90_06035 [Actinomycetota bacterium]|nr:hypothetical protein [Actinomycetota bacterium]